MAQSSGRDRADELTEDAEGSSRSALTSALWADVRIDPVEIALPGGVGYTLRAYRSADEVEAPDIERDPERDQDDFDAAAAQVAATRRRPPREDADEDEEDESQWFADEAAEAVEAEDGEDQDEPDEDEAEAEETDEESAAAEPEEVPLFLGRKGKVYLFHSVEQLVEYVRSGAENDLSQLDTWTELVGRIQAADVEPDEGDRYELDLVVENLRGGPDAWDAAIIIKAGEVARDLAYALRIEPVLTALSPGSPLDDLDDALRTAEEGGLKAIFARRRLRKAGGQQAALGWRTIIGKISAAADWRD